MSEGKAETNGTDQSASNTTTVPARKSWRLFGLELAPVMIPIERRLQTLSVIAYVCMFGICPMIFMLILLLLLFTPLFFVSIGYASWIFYDVAIKKTSSRGGRRLSYVRNLAVWRYFADYFPATLIKTVDLKPDCNYLFGYHPHGVVGCGAVASFGSEARGFSKLFPGITPHLMTLKMNFSLPIIRGFLLWSGICDVSKDSIKYVLTQKGTGNAAIIVTGGAEEALEAHPGTYNLKLSTRKGFVKMAIKTGAALVPVFGFGENDLFYQMENPEGSTLRKFQQKFKAITGLSPPFILGRGIFNYNFGFLPYRHPIDIVVGSPIYLEACETPSDQQINDVHKRYMQQLSDLFDQHKSKYGVPEKMHLQFI